MAAFGTRTADQPIDHVEGSARETFEPGGPVFEPGVDGWVRGAPCSPLGICES
jgi:hypothetical protein